MAADDSQSPRIEDAPPPRKRRRWQFGLSTLLLVVTASATVSWWYARQEPWEEFQQQFTERVKDLGGEIEWGSGESPTRLSFRYWGFSDSAPLTNDKLRALRRDLGRLGPFTLNLSGSRNARGAITDAGLEHLDGLLRLECLCLRHTDVTDAGLEHLARLKGLQFVDLRDTNLTASGLRQIAATRPELIVSNQKSDDYAASNSVAYLLRVSRARAGTDGDIVTFTAFRSEATSGKLDEARGMLKVPPGFYDADPDAEAHEFAPGEALISLHGPISDSGVHVARMKFAVPQTTIVWEAFAQPLGVDHSKYRHDAHVLVHGDRCVLVSDGAATFVEIRDLATGALLKRWVY